MSVGEEHMKVLVTYYSETGNTEKLARAIYDGIEKAEKDLAPIEEAKDLESYALIFCGFPVHSSSVPVKVEPLLKNIPEGKDLVVFATHGSLRGGQLAVTAFDYAMSLASKARVIGTFGCRGKVKSSLLESLSKQPEHRAWAQEALGAGRHPDEGDLVDGRDFARKMVKKARSS
jgi:flavodoxin